MGGEKGDLELVGLVLGPLALPPEGMGIAGIILPPPGAAERETGREDWV